VGSSSSSSHGSRRSQRDSTTFCWLPPESASSVCSGPEVRTPNRSICVWVSCDSAPWAIRKPRQNSRSEAATTFSLMLRPLNAASP
jgi:hypothetical protein